MSNAQLSPETDFRNELIECYRHSGDDIATVFVPTRSDKADADQRFDIQVKNVRKRLEELNAEQDVIDAVLGVLDGYDHHDATSIALVAARGESLLVHPMFRPVARLFVSYGSTPALLPLLEIDQVDAPHVAVLLDRVGADIWYRTDLGTAVETETVDGDDLHIHRSHPGGWSQRRFQQIAENTWEQNAKLVVDEVGDAITDDVEVVVVGGDVRAVGFFTEHATNRFDDLVVVDGSRAAGPEAFLDNADIALRSRAAEWTASSIRSMRDAIGEDRAVTGHDALKLLAQGRVETLYVGNDTSDRDRPTAYFDFDTPLVLDETGGRSAPVTEGAVALAAATGANVIVLPNSTVPDRVVGVRRG